MAVTADTILADVDGAVKGLKESVSTGEDAGDEGVITEWLQSVSGKEAEFGEKVVPVFVTDLKAAVDQNAWFAASAFAQIVAEIAKDEGGRESAGAAGIMEVIVPSLLRTIEEAGDEKLLSAGTGIAQCRVQLLRAVGNLCYQHDANRARFLESGGVAALASTLGALQSSPETTASNDKAAAVGAGAMINASAGSDEIREILVESGILKSLIWLFNAGQGDPRRQMALQALAMFSESKTAIAALAEDGLLKPLIKTLNEAPSEDDEDFADDLDIIVEVLEGMTINVENLGRYVVRDGVWDDIIALSKQSTARPKSSRVASKVVAVSLCEDACVDAVWRGPHGDKFIELMRKWMRLDGDIEDKNLQVAGALAVGNCCRSDDDSRRLRQFDGLFEDIMSLLDKEFTATQHAALGCLKNLTRLPENRKVVVDIGGLSGIFKALHSPQGVLQYSASSLLRTLLSDVPKEKLAEILTSDESIIPRIIHIGRSEEYPVRAEATRLIIQAVKSNHDELVEKLLDGGAATNISSLLTAEHEMLRSEALVAVSLLARFEKNIGKLEKAEVFGRVLTIATTEGVSKPMLLNSIALLGFMVRSKSVREDQDLSPVNALVDSLSNSEDANIQTQIASLRQLLASDPTC